MRDRKNRFSQKAILTYDNYNSYLAAQNFEKKNRVYRPNTYNGRNSNNVCNIILLVDLKRTYH